jgi:predicted XRE-type DNA-binding protein
MYWRCQAISVIVWYRNTPIMYLKFVLELAGDVLVASEAMPDRNHRLIADTLAWLRANRVKQKELAESLGVTPQHMNDILGGRTHLTGEHEPSPCSARVGSVEVDRVVAGAGNELFTVVEEAGVVDVEGVAA